MVRLVDSFYEQRKRFYEQIPSFWDRLYGQEYALYDCCPLQQSEVDAVRTATNETYAIFKKVSELLRKVPEETYLDLGFPKKIIPFLRMRTLPYETVIGRFDFVMTDMGPKLIEFNSDTPTFIRELFEVNREVCQEFGLGDPNKQEEEELGTAIRNSVFHCARSIGVYSHPYVIFTAHEADTEDRETMKYLMRVAKIKGATFLPLSQIQVVNDGEYKGVYDLEGNRIDIVYRHTYPIEALIEDTTVEGFSIGVEFLQLVAERKVGILNPISAFLLQSKAVLALLWGMHEQNHSFFTEHEHEMMDRYLLPTYLDEEPFLETKEAYVSKPVFGREGDTVEIKENGVATCSKREKTYDHFVKVYQKYVDLPVKMINTEQGKINAHLLVGSFIVNEKPSAIGVRAGAKITDNLSYFLPCGLKGDM